jgi:hypothetical protein
MDEAIFLAAFGGDETKALGVVEPLHSAGRTHFDTPGECNCVVGVAERAVQTDPQLLVMSLTPGTFLTTIGGRQRRDTKKEPRECEGPYSTSERVRAILRVSLEPS